VTTSEARDQGYLPAMLNPFEPGFFENPYAQYAAVREADPVHHSPIGAWALFRYEDVHRVLRDTRLSVEEHNAVGVDFGAPDPRVQALMDERGDDGRYASMLNVDPPDHHRLRLLVSKVFTPRVIEEMQPRVQSLVDEHLDAVASSGDDRMELIADLAFPLPFVVISEMLGIPEGRDRLQLREWSGEVVKTFDPILTVDEQIAAFNAGQSIDAYVREVLAWKRDHPSNDVLTALIAAENEGDRLSEAELVENVMLLFIAGHETTVNLIGNGMLALLRHRDQLELWQQHPDEVAATAVDELLRYDSPVQMTRRITLEDIEMGDKVLPAGSLLMTCLGAANRDPAKWGANADDVDLRRADAAQHMSFGGGVHTCLGAYLARLEGRTAIGSLIQRFPNVALATDAPEWNGRIVLRGLNELPLTLN
jgi:cytochrome P450